MEGNEQQRRAAAREAREEGIAPSAAGVTTGASKQRHHLPHSAEHEERVEGPFEGKQDDPEREA